MNKINHAIFVDIFCRPFEGLNFSTMFFTDSGYLAVSIVATLSMKALTSSLCNLKYGKISPCQSLIKKNCTISLLPQRTNLSISLTSEPESSTKPGRSFIKVSNSSTKRATTLPDGGSFLLVKKIVFHNVF